MDIEFEAKFLQVNKNKVRKILKKVGAKLVKPEFLQKRAVFFLPKGHEIEGGWLRVRDEGEKITMSLKIVTNGKIETQKETMLVVDNFEKAREFLTTLGCVEKAWQENKREIWELDGVDITIDEWPFVEAFVEIEGKSEKDVMDTSKKLGFDYTQAIFGSLDMILSKKYGISTETINNKIDKIVFGKENPYLKWIRNTSLAAE